ncbi:MAG: biotin/lipoyl-binding protein [Patescibacteria group bacterium]
MLKKILEFIKKHKIATAIIILILIIASYGIYKNIKSKKSETRYVLGSVEKGTLTSSISGTGQVSETEKVDIKPASSGTVSEIYVTNGQIVKKGETLVVLDQSDALASLNQAQASLKSAQANYDKVLAGTASEDIAVAQMAVKSAQNNLDNAKESYKNTVTQQKTAVSNSYTVLLNSGISGSSGSGYESSASNMVAAADNTSTATVSLTGSYSSTKTGTYKVTVQTNSTGFDYVISGLEKAQGALIQGSTQAFGKNGLYLVTSSTGTFINGNSWTMDVPNKLANNYLSNYNSYQTALKSQSAALNSAENNIQNAQIALEQAQASLKVKQATAKPSDIAAAEAQVASAYSQLQNAQNNYDDTIIKAPFDGIITTMDLQIGDEFGASSGGSSSSSSSSSTTSTSTSVLTLATKEKMAVISLNEVDVTKIKTGQKATLTFDAIEDLSITGKVIEVDASGTVSQGVVSYNAKISLDTLDERIKSGMSVSATVITDIKQNVLYVPSSAVKVSNGTYYVEVPSEKVDGANSFDTDGINLKKSLQQKTVEIGIISDTSTEITSGLNEGDQIIYKTITSSTKSSSSSNSNQRNMFQIPNMRSGEGRTSGMSGQIIPRY